MKTGFTCGIFDLFHAGHVRMLQECKQHCDYLIVALNSAAQIDPEINPEKKPPVYSLEERMLIMRACRFVDEVVVYNSEEELEKLLMERKPDIRFMGEDYQGKKITGASLNIPIHYTDRSHGLSTSKYRQQIQAGK
ncbi:MAG TPA: adenylyltransferase/cytidyltransferase family protein [Bacteroidia bacterium]|nr:adenylyltransferase/cytidyltransferase family protein [Bacteroidia bacterium]